MEVKPTPFPLSPLLLPDPGLCLDGHLRTICLDRIYSVSLISEYDPSSPGKYNKSN